MKVLIMQKPKFLYTFDDQVTLENIIELLKPFRDATVQLSGENSPTLPFVLQSLKKLDLILQAEDSEIPVVSSMKYIMRQNLSKRYPDEEQNLLLMASLLHPGTKNLVFVEEAKRVKVKNNFIESVAYLIEKSRGSNTSTNEGQNAEPNQVNQPIIKAESDSEILPKKNQT